jgi:hypothetical protein
VNVLGPDLVNALKGDECYNLPEFHVLVKEKMLYLPLRVLKQRAWLTLLFFSSDALELTSVIEIV